MSSEPVYKESHFVTDMFGVHPALKDTTLSRSVALAVAIKYDAMLWVIHGYVKVVLNEDGP